MWLLQKIFPKLIWKLSQFHFFDAWDDARYLRLLYWAHLGKKLDLENPKTFNEKLQWLKLHDRNPEYTRMVDKYEAKRYVAERIGQQYVIPTLGVWEHFDEIDFDALPEQFVLKCTHDSGGVVIAKDKATFDRAAAKRKLEAHLRVNYYLKGREWPYKNIKPRIIAEPYLEDVNSDELLDYKLMCFHGRVRCSFACSNRYKETGLCVNFYDENWKPMPFERHYPKNPVEIERPEQYAKMVEIAENLSKSVPFIRVDFYQVGNSLYVGELTFYPGSGMEEFTPDSWDLTVGSWLKLPDCLSSAQGRHIGKTLK